jgi:hypothetical protein
MVSLGAQKLSHSAGPYDGGVPWWRGDVLIFHCHVPLLAAQGAVHPAQA